MLRLPCLCSGPVADQWVAGEGEYCQVWCGVRVGSGGFQCCVGEVEVASSGSLEQWSQPVAGNEVMAVLSICLVCWLRRSIVSRANCSLLDRVSIVVRFPSSSGMRMRVMAVVRRWLVCSCGRSAALSLNVVHGCCER